MPYRYVLSATQIREFETRLVSSGLEEATLMETVAARIALHLRRFWERRKRFKNLLVLAGPGNNGGDACAVLRNWLTEDQIGLMARGGKIRVVEWPGQASSLRRRQAKLLRDFEDVEWVAWPESSAQRNRVLGDLQGPTLVVDGLFGIGFCDRGSWSPAKIFLDELKKCLHHCDGRVAAIDIPSGLDESGSVADDFKSLRAHVSFSVVGPKFSQLQNEGPEQSGQIICVDVGAPYVPEDPQHAWRWLSPRWMNSEREWESVGAQLQRPSRADHKGGRGRVLVVGGTLETGAATKLVAETALRFSAGYVTMVEPPSSKITPAQLAKISGEWLVRQSPRSTKEWAELLKTHPAWVFGCGLPAGGAENSEKWNSFWEATMESPTTKESVWVVDGGGLSSFVSEWKARHMRMPGRSLILTPHPKEAGDMLKALGLKVPELRWELFASLKNELESLGMEGALLLKGAHPLIAPLGKSLAPQAVIELASARLATAGSGDVLAGALAAAALRMKADRASDRAWSSLLCAITAQSEASRKVSLGALASEISVAMGQSFAGFLEKRG